MKTVKTEKTETEKIVEQLRLKISKAQARVNMLRERLGEDAFEALAWLHDTIGPAAELRVFPSVIQSLEKGMSPRHVLLCSRDNTLRIALHGAHRSSGVVDAQLQAEELRAWTEIVELLRGFASTENETVP